MAVSALSYEAGCRFLIYPYWNINLSICSSIKSLFIVSNLSILECKSFTIFSINNYFSRFLIYPYWNINVSLLKSIMPCFKVSNLSIMECKLMIMDRRCFYLCVSNISILECKLYSKHITHICDVSF